MITQALTLSALFFGIALITIGNGLQGTLLGVRGAMEGFSIGTLGFIMSSYYGGFLLGSLYVQKLIPKVGHIRAFVAFASLASIAILLHSVILDPIFWGFIRVVSGFSFAGLFVVIESWLNDQSSNENRGKILSIYMAINHGGFLIGQLLLNLAHPEGFSHFILISILLSFALIPISITVSPFPCIETLKPIGIKELYKISPTGLVCGAGVGISHGAVWGLGPVFAQKLGFDIQGISLFMGAVILGGFFFQWPIGILSDRYDRRTVLCNVVWLGALFSFFASLISPTQLYYFLIAVLIFGGVSLPIYSLCIAHVNDHLNRNQMVAAGSTMVLVYGAGAFLGPLIASIWMEVIGPLGFFYHLTFVHIILGIFILLRIKRSSPVPLEKQEAFIPIPPRTSPVVAILEPNPTDESVESTDD